jgi:hypothetical protein
VELLLGLAALLTAGSGFAHFLKKVSELRTALVLQGELQLLRVARALKQEADGTGAGMGEGLAVKPLDSARALTSAVAGSGGGGARGVQLVLGASSSSSAAPSCRRKVLSSGEIVNASAPYVPLSKKAMALAQE